MNIDLSGVRIALISLGCDKNLVDSEVMLGLVTSRGAVLTNNCAQADIIVVNTCGFISDASQESVDAVLDAVEFKTKSICKAVIVTGCMAERYKDDIFNELTGVDAIVGANKHGELADVIFQILNKAQPVSVYGRDDGCYFGTRIVSTNHYAYLKIAEGCDNHCTYCSIPSIRGSYRSRTIESLLEEASALANGKSAVKELILVAQDTSLYGTDIYGEPKLAELLNKLSKIDKIKRLRLLYCYPQHITDGLIDEMSANPKIAHYIDMPIQHAADSVLKRMGRSTPNIKALVSKLRAKMPDITLRTTLITGFPGETENEFNVLVDFVKDIKFDRLGVFAYSREEGTPADKLPNHLPSKLKEQRKNKIMSIQQKISANKLKEKVGTQTYVLIEGKTPDSIYFGRGHMDAPSIDGVVFVKSNKELTAGDFLAVKLTSSSEYDLEGAVVDESTQ